MSAILVAGFLAMIAAALDYPPAARSVPLLVGCGGALLGAAQLVRTLRGLRRAAAESTPTFTTEHLAMFGWLIAAAALVAAFGILAGGAVFVTAFLRGRLRESWLSAFQSGLLLAAVLHLGLERALGVYLFEGLIAP